MTREQEAALNEKIATLLGWRHCLEDKRPWIGVLGPCIMWVQEQWIKSNGDWNSRLTKPKYTSNPADTWALVEWLWKQEMVDVQFYPPRCVHIYSIEDEDKESPTINVTHENPAKALCLAVEKMIEEGE